MDVGGDDGLPSMDDWIPASSGSVKTPKIKRHMKNFPTDIAKTRIKRDKFPISPLFYAILRNIFPPFRYAESFYTGWSCENDGTGFGKVHAKLREIPEVVSARKPLRGNGR